MKRLVWVCIISASLGCSGGSQDLNRSGTEPTPGGESSKPIVQKTGGVTATSCKTKYPIKSWDDRTSKYGFCERLGYRLSDCEMPYGVGGAKGICEYLDASAKKRVDIADECMTHDFDVANVPSMITTLEACECGDEYAETRACTFRDCDDKIACLQAAGLQYWTSRR